MIIENLQYFLSQFSPYDPLYFGSKFNTRVAQGYMSGGAGYVLSREAVRRFVVDAIPNSELCKTQAYGLEDAELGKCLENVHVLAGDSRDGECGRFFPFTPETHLIGTEADDFWYWQFRYYKTPKGRDCCSDTSISFHYIPPKYMYTLDYLIYNLNVFGMNNIQKELPRKKTIEQIRAEMISNNDIPSGPMRHTRKRLNKQNNI